MEFCTESTVDPSPRWDIGWTDSPQDTYKTTQIMTGHGCFNSTYIEWASLRSPSARTVFAYLWLYWTHRGFIALDSTQWGWKSILAWVALSTRLTHLNYFVGRPWTSQLTSRKRQRLWNEESYRLTAVRRFRNRTKSERDSAIWGVTDHDSEPYPMAPKKGQAITAVMMTWLLIILYLVMNLNFFFLQ